jgi:hypothetical protein
MKKRVETLWAGAHKLVRGRMCAKEIKVRQGRREMGVIGNDMKGRKEMRVGVHRVEGHLPRRS